MNLFRHRYFIEKFFGEWANPVLEILLWLAVLIVCAAVYEIAIRPIMGYVAIAGIVGWAALVGAMAAVLPAWWYTEYRWRKLKTVYKKKLADLEARE